MNFERVYIGVNRSFRQTLVLVCGIYCNKFLEPTTSMFCMGLEWIFTHVNNILCKFTRHKLKAHGSHSRRICPCALCQSVSVGIISHILWQSSSSCVHVLQSCKWSLLKHWMCFIICKVGYSFICCYISICYIGLFGKNTNSLLKLNAYSMC